MQSEFEEEEKTQEDAVSDIQDTEDIETQEQDGLLPKTHFLGKILKVGLAGALVDIGQERPGALHISQIVAEDGQLFKRVEDVLQPGKEIDVWVRRTREDRVELTMIKPLDLDWRDIKLGMTVKGKVVRLEKFGAFVEIGAERPGLVHISEMAHGFVRQPSDVVQEGDEIEAQVIDVNRRKRQIKLSMKAIQSEPEPLPEPMPEPMEMPRRERQPRGAKGGGRKGKGGRRGDEYGGSMDDIMAALGHSEGEDDSETAMAIAWKEAMEKDKSRRDDKSRKNRGATSEQEDIFSRTLERKIN